jgi:hypothetical protein
LGVVVKWNAFGAVPVIEHWSVMPSQTRRLLVVSLIGLGFGVAGCARKSLDYAMSVSDFHGAEGYTLTYDVIPRTVQITLSDDYGHPPKVVWQAALTPEQQRKFSAFAEHLPVDRLKDKYEPDGLVFDGYQYTYKLRIGNKPAREIIVNNVSQPQLDPLIDLINELVPEKYRVASPRASVSFPRPTE